MRLKPLGHRDPDLVNNTMKYTQINTEVYIGILKSIFFSVSSHLLITDHLITDAEARHQENVKHGMDWTTGLD